MNEYFVYALVDPRNGSIFYIGKGKDDRPRQHLVESLRYKNDTKNAINPYKTRKILNILNAGYDSYDILYLHENLTEEQAFELEKYEIANHSNLTNIGKGGDGGDNISNNPRHDEICKKISESGKRRYKDPNERIKCSRPGKLNGMYGKTHTDEVKQKISECHKGKTYEEQYGIEKSKEIRHKVSIAVKERMSHIENISWAVKETEEQVVFIKNAMESGNYSWYLLEKQTGLTKKIITRICKSHNIIINTLKLSAGNFDKYYGEDAEQHRYNKSVCHRGKLNGRYKDGKMCKSYDNPAIKAPVAV